MDETSPVERGDVSRLSRRGLLALGATLAGTSGIGMFSGTAAAHELMAFRDAFVGDDADKEGLGSKGWLFFAKDIGTVYYHNGSGWVDLGIGGGDGALVDSDDDGLLEAPDYDGIDVGQVEAESVSTTQLSADNIGTRIYSSTDQTIPTGTNEKVAFDTTTFDHLSWGNLSEDEIVVDEAGTYLLSGSVRYEHFGSTDRLHAEIQVSGNRVDRDESGASGTYPSRKPQSIRELSDGDNIKLITRQETAGEQTVQGIDHHTHLEVVKLG